MSTARYYLSLEYLVPLYCC